MNAVFMGTSEFAAYCFSRIAESRTVEIKAVYCKPEESSHRHRKDLPVHREALLHNVPVFFPSTLKAPSAPEDLKKIAPDLILVIDYGLILPADVLGIPRMGCFNLHASLLPAYRGAAPIQRALMNGDRKTGVTVMHMTEEVDAGDIVFQKEVDVAEDDDFFSLSEKLEEEGAVLMVELLQSIKEGKLPRRIPQDHSQASHAHKIRKEEGTIRWEDSPWSIHNRVRGLAKWPGASCRMKLYGKEHVIKIISTTHRAGPSCTDLFPGTIVGISGEELAVAAGGSCCLCVTRLQVEGRKAVTAREFVNGFHIRKGDVFY